MSFAVINLNPLYRGESKSEKADTILWRIAWLFDAVVEDTTVLISTSYPGCFILFSIASISSCSNEVIFTSLELVVLLPYVGGFQRLSNISNAGATALFFLPLPFLIFSIYLLDNDVHLSSAGRSIIWIDAPSPLETLLNASSKDLIASRRLSW